MPSSSPEIPYLPSVLGLQHTSPSIQYIHDASMVWQNGTTTVTGGFRPIASSEIGGASLSGATAPPELPFLIKHNEFRSWGQRFLDWFIRTGRFLRLCRFGR